MKKIIKNNLKVFIAVIITLVISITGTVYAVDNFFARDISFTANNENKANGFTATNVDEALNQLYQLKEDGKTVKYSDSYRDQRSTSNNASVDLEKGNYICNFAYVQGTSNSNTKSKYVEENVNYEINIDSCEVLNETSKYQYSYEPIIDNRYVGVVYQAVNLKCKINENTKLTVNFKNNANKQFPVGTEVTCNKI